MKNYQTVIMTEPVKRLFTGTKLINQKNEKDLLLEEDLILQLLVQFTSSFEKEENSLTNWIEDNSIPIDTVVSKVLSYIQDTVQPLFESGEKVREVGGEFGAILRDGTTMKSKFSVGISKSLTLASAIKECLVGNDFEIDAIELLYSLLTVGELDGDLIKLLATYGIHSEFLLDALFQDGDEAMLSFKEELMRDPDWIITRRVLDNIMSAANFSEDEDSVFDLKAKEFFGSFEGSQDEGDEVEDDNNSDEKKLSDEEAFEVAGKSEALKGKVAPEESKTPYLDEFSFNLTREAREGKFDPVIGRDVEIQRITEILCCRKKNNLVLLGDPGCGKTAIVEHLAQLIVDEKIPKELLGKKIYSLDLNSLVSGTKYRGDFEKRLQGIIQEVANNPEIIIYIDEFHNLVGNGGSSGNGDAANILKPYLARGEFQCIGSTTLDEYRKFIEKDGALKRRFQNVIVDEPTESDTIQILGTLSKKYGEFHKVNFPASVVSACVYLSNRYITDRFFPDKAIDILDSVGALVKLNSEIKNQDVERLEIVTKDLELAKTEFASEVQEGNLDVAEVIQEKTIKPLEKEIKRLSKKSDNFSNNSKNWPTASLLEVYQVISKQSGVPIDNIERTDIEKLKNMKTALLSKIVGQDDAVNNVTISLQRNFLGLRDPKKPIASVLLVGPTGVGKTQICKDLAVEFFGAEKSLIRFDMAEFANSHEVTKLLGAAASFVGYDSAPLLEQVRRNPYSVILFDEIEKAHADIYNIFLNILDEGYVTLANGTKVDFRNTIVVFTGNVGTKELSLKGNGLGFSSNNSFENKKKETNSIVMSAVKKQFRPEFLNRLTGVTVFNSLTKCDLLKIIDLELMKLSKRLLEKKLILKVSQRAKEYIVDLCKSEYGARDLQRGIITHIENNLCDVMLENTTNVDFSKKVSVIVDLNKTGEIEVSLKQPKSKIVKVI